MLTRTSPMGDLRQSNPQVARLQGVAAFWDLGFSKLVDLAGSVVDVARESAAAFVKEIEAAARDESLTVTVSFGGLRLVPLRGFGRSRIVYRLRRRTSYFRVLVGNRNGMLLDTIECRVWDRRQNHWITLDRKAPLRRHIGDAASPRKGSVVRSEFSFAFPIDAVVTWVNSDDPEWRRLYANFQPLETVDRDRFSQADELRYALRSIRQNARWIRRVYTFSNCQPPSWFQETELFRWIFHSDVVPDSRLPLFNSHSIETYLHHISELSENFIYFNDDFFLADVAFPGDYFHSDGRSIAKFEPYGMVNYYAQLSSRRGEWINAALNGARLLQDRFGIFPTRLHEHAPYALRRSVLEQIEREFAGPIELTRENRFRSHQDLSLTSFFYHHYAELCGLGTSAPARTFLVRPENAKLFARKAFGKRRYQAVCINDGNRSAADADFSRFKRTFLQAAFPYAAECERGA
jgi:hypothetical protein